MIYVDYEVPMPEDRLTFTGDNVYRYLGSHRENGKLKHERVYIGKRIVVDDKQRLLPNDNYFDEYKKPKPTNATLRGRGRPRKNPVEISYRELPPNRPLGFGYGIAVVQIARESGLLDAIQRVWGDEISMKILAVAAHYARGESSLTNLEHFTSRQMCFTNTILTSQRACELFSSIEENNAQDFFRNWIKLNLGGRYACYDVTSVSSYAREITHIAWGYNRDHEKLPQFNVGLFARTDNGMPLYCSSYNGAINDFTNLPAVARRARSAGLNDKFMLVMDGAFCDGSTVDYVSSLDYKFLVGAPLADNYPGVSAKVLAWHTSQGSALRYLDSSHDSHYICESAPFQVSNTAGNLLMYRFKELQHEQEMGLLDRLSEMECLLSDKHLELTTQQLKGCEKFFTVSGAQPGRTFSRNTELIENELALCGAMALFTNDFTLEPSGALRQYRFKDHAEKGFADLKNEIMGERMRVHTKAAMQGKLLMLFIALVLRKLFRLKLGDYIRENRSSLDDCIKKLMDIECVKYNGHWVLRDSLTRCQKDLTAILGLPISNLSLT